MRTFTRAEFYELVWTKPMTTLAKEFALSDVALHKVCRKHNIPTTPVGWWAKHAAGKSVRRTPLPKLDDGSPDRITIAAGELRAEPDLIASARENARLLASTIGDDVGETNRFVERTVAKLRKAKPSETNGLVSVGASDTIKSTVAPASIERLQLALARISAAANALGIEIIPGGDAPMFAYEGETVAFSITEAVRREKHVPTQKELAEQEAARKRRARRWNNPREWDDIDFTTSFLRMPDWDYHPTGQLAFELEQSYLLSGSPRRSFRDAKVQRIESIAADIAVGIVVLAVAKKDDRLNREEQARQREEERRQREIALRQKHVDERRGKALDDLLEELASLDRLRRLVAGLGAASLSGGGERVAAFRELAERKLASREGMLSAEGLEQRFAQDRIFGDDDDHGFRSPPHYY